MDTNVPPVYPPRPPAPPPTASIKRGSGWKILALILALFLGISLLDNIRGFFRPATSPRSKRHGERWLEEIVIEQRRTDNKIAVIEVEGLITGMALDRGGYNMVSFIKDQLKIAADDRHVKAVLLKIDSPGGEVLASDAIYHALADFQKTSGKPVVASMGGLAASGGYYVSAPCQWIVANELTITGSIGVILHTYNYRNLLEKVGVRPMVFKSGKFKDMLSPDKLEEQILPEERQMVQQLIDDTFDRFKQVVAEGRGWSARKNQGRSRPLSPEWKELADGRILSGKQAYEHGFVDELGSLEKAVERAKKLANISDADLIRYQQPFDLGNLLRFFGRSEGKSIKLDWGMDLPPKLKVGRLYFLSSTVLH